MKFKPIATAIAAGTLLGIGSFGAFAQLPPTNPIDFDADGQGGANGTEEVQTFDWAVSSLLTLEGVCPDPTDPDGCFKTFPIQTADPLIPTYLNALTHAALQGFQDANGNPAGAPAGLNTDFELTFVAGACVKAQIISAFAINLTLNPSPLCVVPNGSGQFFEIWYDKLGDGVGVKSDALTGAGYRDGKLILSGSVVQLAGTNAFTDTPPNTTTVLFDQYLGDSYGGKMTVLQEGSTSVVVLVDEVDKDFFRSGVDHGSLLPFTGQVRLPYKETNPSANFYTGANPVAVGTSTALLPDEPADLGTTNGDGPDFEQQADASNAFTFLPPLEACRVTGGGNDTSGLNAALDGWDETVATDQMKPPIKLKALPLGKLKKLNSVTAYYYYTFGGQAGANTALQPQPKGQWEHNNHSSPSGLQFAFHGGKNAPAGTQIDEIRCTDEGWCVQARPAPDKQIDFVGIGTFSNISNNSFTASDGVIFDGIQDVVPEPKTGQPGLPVPTYHWFQVHIEDLGEPGSQQGLTDADDPVKCPPQGSGNNPFANPAITDKLADCDCKDFYRITIYKGVTPAVDGDGKVILDANGDIPGIDKTNKIYEVYGYIDGGNFQIHPLTGFDLH